MGPRGGGEGELLECRGPKMCSPKKVAKVNPKKGAFIFIVQKSLLFFEAVKGCQVNWEVFVWLA